jgi:hypothetical protein
MQTKHNNFAACHSVSINQHFVLIIYFCVYSTFPVTVYAELGQTELLPAEMTWALFWTAAWRQTVATDGWRVTSLKFERDEA